jgi:hypothetical protein
LQQKNKHSSNQEKGKELCQKEAISALKKRQDFYRRLAD